MSRPQRVADRELLSAARKVFLKEGFQAPVSAVAKELGVSVGALFFRMKSKEQLLARALMPAFPPPEMRLLEQESPPTHDPRRHLLTLLSGLCDFLPEALPGFFLLHTAGVLPSKDICSETIDVAMRNALAAWLRRAKSRKLISVAIPDAAADAVIGAMEARFLHAYLLRRTFSPAQNRTFVKRLLAVILPPRRDAAGIDSMFSR